MNSSDNENRRKVELFSKFELVKLLIPRCFFLKKTISVEEYFLKKSEDGRMKDITWLSSGGGPVLAAI